jgi:hypothetical protein
MVSSVWSGSHQGYRLPLLLHKTQHTTNQLSHYLSPLGSHPELCCNNLYKPRWQDFDVWLLEW